MASELIRVSGSGEGLDGLTDEVLKSPVFGKRNSPTVAELLMLMSIKHRVNIPARVIEAACGKYTEGIDGESSELLRSGAMLWNDHSKEHKAQHHILALYAMSETVKLLGCDLPEEIDSKSNQLKNALNSLQAPLKNILNT